MDDEITVIKNVKVRYLTTKMDKYDNEIIWFKIDKTSIDKLVVLNKVGFKLPYFETDDGKTLLKVKSKNVSIDDIKPCDIPYFDNDDKKTFKKVKSKTDNIIIACDICFKYYKINDIEGFYVYKLS